ncbi:Bardet-Biedl syndrome 9 isoform X2 [Rhodnius prolixus]|uniref:Bardet-Biedl syndrome 9 isoform X2 n=1 Tax=Rhodnius prolixus TaxID=13249 RepID=UPI003D18EE2D
MNEIGSKNICLAILHPRSVAVYNFITISGSTEHGDQSQVIMVYEHNLKRTAYCILVGGFGGVAGRDFLCIQSLDGTLLFYEQETLTLSRQLPNFLLPSPIIYVPHTDSFVVLTSNWFLHSYRYQSLGEETSVQLMPSWEYNLGENVLEMNYLSLTTTEAAIFLMTDSNMYCFSETGILKFFKRLQLTPLCSHIYSRGEPLLMSLIVSDTNTLMVYENATLQWSAQLLITPIAVSRANFQGLYGCVVVLSDNGSLQVCYLGTEPTLFVPPPLQENVKNISEMETKLAALQHQIATYSQSAKNLLGAPLNRPDVKISLKVWPILEGESSCKIEISIQAVTLVHNVHATVAVHSPLTALPNSHVLQNLSDSSELYSEIHVEPSHTVVSDLEISVMVVYLCSDLTSGSVSASTTLPAHFVLELSPPANDLDVNLNLSVSNSVILPTLFPEFSASSWNETGSNENLAGFRYRHSPDIGFTITLIRSQQKYKIETNTISCLTLPLSILNKKLFNKLLRTSQYSLAMNELLEATDNNVELRNQIRDLQLALKQGTSQMRVCQKRLLSIMRDKTPSDLTALTELINFTHEHVMDTAYKMETAQKDLQENGNRLASLLKLTLCLVKLSGSALPEDLKNVIEAVSYTNLFSENQGWAEVSEIGLNHLLRTSLARSIKDQYMPPTPDDLVVTNSSTLKKYITATVERLVAQKALDDNRPVSPILEGEDESGGIADTVHSSKPALYQEFDAEIKETFTTSISEAY